VIEVVNGLVVIAAIISTALVFVKTLQHTGSMTKAVIAASIVIDFILIVMYVLGIDRPLFAISLQRLGITITITALTIFIPFKLYFTIYLLAKQRSLQQILG